MPSDARAPTTAELVQRLEKDIEWFKRRGLWTRALFERAVARYIDAGASTQHLDTFVARHSDTKWLGPLRRRAS